MTKLRRRRAAQLDKQTDPSQSVPTSSSLARSLRSAPSSEAAVADPPLRLPLELIEAILAQAVEILSLESSDGPTAFQFCLRVGETCRHFNAWAEQRMTRSLKIGGLDQLEDSVRRLQDGLKHFSQKLARLEVILTVNCDDKDGRAKRKRQVKALEQLLGLCSQVRILKLGGWTGTRPPVISLELIMRLPNLHTLCFSHVKLDVFTSTRRWSLHLSPPFIQLRTPPPLASPCLRSVRFHDTTFVNVRLRQPAPDVHFSFLFPSATLLTLTHNPFDYTPLDSFGGASWSSLLALAISPDFLGRHGREIFHSNSFPPSLRLVKLALCSEYGGEGTDESFAVTLDDFARAFEGDGSTLSHLEAIFLELHEDHILVNMNQLWREDEPWERFQKAAQARGVEVVPEEDGQVVDIGEDGHTRSVVEGKKTFVERVREL